MALKPKRIFFWLHLVVGLVSGLFIALLALTGATIAYGPQLIEFSQRDITRVSVAATPKLPVEELLKKAKEQVPELAPAGITVFNEPGSAVIISGGRGKPSYYVNPYTGELKEQGAKKSREFVQFMTGLHRWLAMTGDARNVGKTIVGCAGIAFAFVCLSGLVIWWPRQLKLRVMKPSVWFIKGAKGRVRDWNWHNVFGFWSLPVIATLAVTGAMIGFPWARGLLYYAVGEKPPVRREGPPSGGEGSPRRAEAAASSGGGERRAEGAPVSENREQSREAARPESGAARPAQTFTPPAPDAKPLGYDDALAVVTKDNPEWEYVSFMMAGGARQGGGEGMRHRENSSGGDRAPSENSGERRERPASEDAAAAASDEAPRQRRRRSAEGEPVAGEKAPRAESTSRAEGSESAGRGEETRPRRRREGGARRSSGTGALTVRLKRSDTATLFAQVAYTLHPYTGEVLKNEGFGDKSAGEKLAGSVRNVHTGEGFGWFGQTVMFLGSVITLILVYTGFALSWRRFFPGKKNRHHQHRDDGKEPAVLHTAHEPPAK